MRHFTWAVTWILVGLAVTLATASVIQQQATLRLAQQHPAAAPSTAPEAVPADKPKTAEPTHSLVLASRRHHALDD